VDDGLILETTFLVDLEREVARGAGGPAQAFLESRAETPLFITFTIAGELAAGMPQDGRARWEAFVAPFDILPCTADVCWHYAQAFRYLKANGLLIGTNDLWIAATAMAFRKSLVTRNVREYRRVPGVEVVDYRTL